MIILLIVACAILDNHKKAEWIVSTINQTGLGTDHYFLSGGLPFLGLADNFLLRVMRFKQFFSLHFIMKTIFYDHF